MRELIEGLGTLTAVSRSHLQVILQIASNTPQVCLDLDSMLAKQIRIADARKLQQLGRLDCPCGKDNLPRSIEGSTLAVLQRLDAHCSAVLDYDLGDRDVRNERQIGAFEGGVKKRSRGAEASVIACVDLEIAGAGVIPFVEV